MNEKYIDFLKKYKANLKKHSNNRSLLEHLIGTYNLLKHWGIAENVCIAGLFHSVYGNERFTDKILNIKKRELLFNLIGKEAELLVYYFNASNREKTLDNASKGIIEITERKSNISHIITKKQLSDLIFMIFANALEQLPQNDMLSKEDYIYLKNMYEKCKVYINKKAEDSYQSYLEGKSIYNNLSLS